MINNFEIQRWIRFLIVGIINTTLTYGVYLILMLIISYQIAYLIAYFAGVLFAYWFNAVFVFKVALSWKGIFSYPVIYVIQYFLSALLLDVFVETIHIDKVFAPLIIIILMIPISYLLNKYVLTSSPSYNK